MEDNAIPICHCSCVFGLFGAWIGIRWTAEKYEIACNWLTVAFGEGIGIFLCVFMWCEEGCFRITCQQHESTEIGKERRLCYVGMTPCDGTVVFDDMQESRRLHRQRNVSSRVTFFKRSSAEFLERVRVKTKMSMSSGAYEKRIDRARHTDHCHSKKRAVCMLAASDASTIWQWNCYTMRRRGNIHGVQVRLSQRGRTVADC